RRVVRSAVPDLCLVQTPLVARVNPNAWGTTRSLAPQAEEFPMKPFLKSLLASFKRSKKARLRRRPSDCRALLNVEGLEDRLVATVSSMTQLARMFPTHVGPTHLYLNFDGGQSVDAYNKWGGTTNADIQDILFRTSEIFTPFNVEVSRRFGANNFDQGTA